jgi:hypothetical protein
MTEMVQTNNTSKSLRDKLRGAKVKMVGLSASALGLVGAASAEVDINATVGPILDSVSLLIPTIINLIVAIVPAIIVMAVVGFIVAFFDRILGLMKL